MLNGRLEILGENLCHLQAVLEIQVEAESLALDTYVSQRTDPVNVEYSRGANPPGGGPPKPALKLVRGVSFKKGELSTYVVLLQVAPPCLGIRVAPHQGNHPAEIHQILPVAAVLQRLQRVPLSRPANLCPLVC